MSRMIDITGNRYGRLTVIRVAQRSVNGTHIIWECRCDCGNNTSVRSPDLRNGKTQSCGCLKDEKTSKRFRKHPKGTERLQNVYYAMRARCTNPDDADYPRYGGRGINVCEKWKSGPDQFIDWALSNGYRNGLLLDRIDNDAGYNPDNCRWADDYVQANNRSNTRLVTYRGIERPVSELCRDLNINRSTVIGRLNRGWSIEEAVSIPAGQSRC